MGLYYSVKSDIVFWGGNIFQTLMSIIFNTLKATESGLSVQSSIELGNGTDPVSRRNVTFYPKGFWLKKWPSSWLFLTKITWIIQTDILSFFDSRWILA